MLESWWKLLESSIIYPLEKYTTASIRASTTSPGSPVVLRAPAEFDAYSRSTGHFWLLALCCIPLLMGMFCSRTSQLQERRGKLPLLAQAFLLRFSSDPFSFPHQHYWVHQFLWGDQHSQIQPVSGAGQGQKFILVHLSS